MVDLDEEDGSFHEDFPDFDGHNGYSKSGLRQAALDAGFADVKIDTFYYDIRKGRAKDTPYSLFIMAADV